MAVYEFYSLGLGDPMTISGAHGIGLGDLLDKVIELMPKKELKPYEGITSFCVIGRPNVGKSSLVNAILKRIVLLYPILREQHEMQLIRLLKLMTKNI